MIGLYFAPMILFVLFPRSQEIKKIILFFVVSMMVILFTFQNNYTGQLTDFDAYDSLWNYFLAGGKTSRLEGYDTSDLGFRLLMSTISKFTSYFSIFAFVVILLSLIFMYIGFNLLTKELIKEDSVNSIVFVFCLYFMYPFIYDLIQIRFFLSYSIVFYSIILLINKKSIWKYFILILIASSIHSSSIIYLVLPILKFIKTKYLVVIIFFSTTVFYFFSNTISQLPFLDSLLKGKQQYLTLSKEVSLGSSLFYIIAIFTTVILTFLCLNKSKISFPFNIELTKKINIFLLVITPFLFQNLDVERIFRPLYLLDWFLIYYSLGKKMTYRKLLYVSLLLVIQLLHVTRLNSLLSDAIINVLNKLFNL